MGALGAVIIVWGGRCSTIAFFICGGSQLVLPFPPTVVQGLSAAFYFLVAMVFLITAEAMAVYLVWISVFSTRTDPDAPAQFNKTLINTFSVFGMAANAIKGIRRATIDPLDAKDKNTKTKKTKEQKSQRLR